MVETATVPDSATTASSTSAATGSAAYLASAPATASLSNLDESTSLVGNTPVLTFSESGAPAGHVLAYVLGGSGSSSFTLNSATGVLSTAAVGVSGVANYPLTVQVNDTIAGTNLGQQPFEIVVV